MFNNLFSNLWRAFRAWPRWAQVVTVLVLIGVIAGTASSGGGKKSPSANPPATSTSSPPPPKPSKPAMSQKEKDARAWIKNLGFDAGKVQANLQVVQIAIGIATKQSTQANVDKLALYAQQGHDSIDAIRDAFASTNEDSGNLGNAELSAFSGANDLKNALGALVAYTGTPNAATLASFTTQYDRARSEWNSGVRTIWRIAHKKHPPTV